MPLVDSIKRAKDTVGQAFDQLIADVQAEETDTADTGTPSVEKVTITYSDGSSADFAPPGSGSGDTADEVKDLTQEVPTDEGEKSDSQAPTPTGDNAPPGNAEQV